MSKLRSECDHSYPLKDYHLVTAEELIYYFYVKLITRGCIIQGQHGELKSRKVTFYAPINAVILHFNTVLKVKV